MRSIKSLLIGIMLLSVLPTTAQQAFKQLMRETSQEFFQSDEARRIGDQLLLYQRVTGGWPKNIDMAKPLSDKEREKIAADKHKHNDSTTDNDATTLQIYFLSRLYQSTKDVRYRDAFRQGVAYLLSGQYENGGWPQFWPVMRDYQIHITYNDDAMANTMILLRDIAAQKEPYQGDLTDDQLRQQMTKAFNKGIECILNTQIVTDGELTVWCQQHDRETLLPAHARAFELPSYCTMESAMLTRLLMELPNPDERVKKAVHAAMRWFDKYKLTGYKVERTGRPGSADQNTKLVKDTLAPPMWARFYDLELCEPFVCDRDGVPRRHLEQIGAERRNGYAWYTDRPISLYKRYQKWAKKYDPNNRVDISLETKGANENGTIEWFRKPTKHTSDYDAVVKPGDNIQQAIEKAPAVPKKPYKILIRKGTYQQKVIIDRPNNDALALWAKGGGMYYHADLYLRSLGVDFLCPRGWCYATRCRFEGDGHAIIWHDGRGDKHQKLVIKDSWFDAKRPTPLGRYHHDSQFFLMNCRLSSQILDQNISYAYTDKVLDPCPWGQRAYYYNCHREGGDSGWLKNNIEKSEEKPDFHGVTALWTFNNKWDPENRIRDLWNVLAY